MSSKSRIQLENWLKTIDVKGSVLDVGGSQNPIQGRTHSFDSKDYSILDLQTPHELKQKANYTGDFQEIGDVRWDIFRDRNIPDKSFFPESSYHFKYYDMAFCIEVMEYIYNPIAFLRGINRVLKDDGLLYISFHYFYPIHNPPYKDFLRYTPDGAVKVLEESGFEILEHQFRYLEDNESIGKMCDIISVEGMRPRRDPPVDLRVIGSLIIAIKKRKDDK